MSAEPQRDTNQPAAEPARPAAGSAAAPLVDALKAQAAVQQRLEESQRRVETARAADAAEARFCWHTHDDREAEMRIYFHRREELDVVACQLEHLDDRLPTAAERAQLEEAFDAELQAGGDLWIEVASAVFDS